MTQENSVLLLRDKMKKADFRLVDLAEFLDISRPTAYKFIEFYELGQRQRLESKVLRLFEFIDKDEVPSKTELTGNSPRISSRQIRLKSTNSLRVC